MGQGIPMTRSELYDLVWSKSVRQVAAALAVSDVAVAKRCRALAIPIPPRGSWAKRQHGHKVPRPPLPALPDHCDPPIVFVPARRRQAAGQRGAPTAPVERIEMATDLTRLVPMVRRLRQRLQTAKNDYDGLLTPNDDTPCPILVSRQQVDRACLIVQTLVDALASRGYALADADDAPGARAEQPTLAFFLTELIKPQPIVDPEARREHEYADRGWSIPEMQERRPCGEFELRIFHNRRPIRRWFDRKASTLEERLHEVVSDCERFLDWARQT